MATAIGFPTPHVHGAHHPHHGHSGLHDIAFACAISGLVLVCVGDPFHTDALTASSASAIEPEQPVEGQAVVDASVEALEGVLADAEVALADSDGRVLDDSVRAPLASRIAQGERSVSDARLLGAVADPGALPEAWSATAAAQSVLADRLRADVAAVAAAVSAWEAEQARIAAEQEAARRAAEAAARAQVRTRPAGVAAAAGPYVEGIWTSGGQAEIDACRGSVNMPDIAGYLGGDFYAAEHWSCGGSRWSRLGTGALVSFPGFGVYQVAGQVGGLPSGSSAASLPSGYDGYYQTCMNGNVNNLYVWLLTRVG